MTTSIHSFIKDKKRPDYKDTLTTTRLFVKDYTKDYAEAITENYRRQHIRSLKHNATRYTASGDKSLSDYATEQLKEIEDGTAKLMRFKIYEGRKYYKIVQQDYREASEYYNTEAGYRDGSVHCFVDKKSGDVYKAASWNAPAKHVRYSFQNTKHLRFLLDPNNVGWAGGYLYMR
jgi:hypothetical protein|tara:strand:- start:392 stop:916 length:525 start_codon:yes stop_codon:yes gene_type:complete